MVVLRNQHDPLPELLAFSRLGAVVRILWDGAEFLFLNEPELIEGVLLDRQRSFVRAGGPKRLARLLGNGLLRSQGELHKQQRLLWQPVFHASRLEEYRRIMQQHASARLSRWREDRVFDLHREISALTLSIAAKAFFGVEDSARVTKAGRNAGIAISNLASATGWREHWRIFRFELAVRELEAFMGCEGQRRDELMTLLIAGHETTASSLVWACECLSRDPATQASLRASPELARAVFAETLRLYPPAWILVRQALENVTIGEHRIRKGELVLVSPYTMGRDERFFKEASHFLPSRWEGPEPRRGIYFPFGLGNRRCLGESFAWLEGVELLNAVVQPFELVPATEMPVEPKALFTLRPDRGLPMRVRRVSRSAFPSTSKRRDRNFVREVFLRLGARAPT